MNSSLEKTVVDLTEYNRSRFFGKYRGLVEENDDPEGLGRIKARVPEVLGNTIISEWALPCLPYSGSGSGQFMIPPKNAGVWIEFEGGRYSSPIWSGCWWGSNEVPKDADGRTVDKTTKIIRSEEGLILALNDGGKTIALSDTNGTNILKIEVQQGKATLQSGTKAVVQAPQIDLTDSAAHPLVFGDQLLQYLNQLVLMFNTHLHPGETLVGIPVTPAPPAPIFPPATPVLLSTRVKTG